MGLLRRGGHERPHSAPGFEDAAAFEFGIDACDGIGVDLNIHRQLPDRGQLGAWTKRPCGDGGPQSALELRVDGRAVARIDPDKRHMTYCTSVLIQVSRRNADRLSEAGSSDPANYF